MNSVEQTAPQPPFPPSIEAVDVLDKLPAALSNITTDSLASEGTEASQIFQKFCRATPPAISVADYLTRLCNYLHPEVAVLLGLLVYAERIAATHGQSITGPSAIHRFLLAGLVVGSKALGDTFYADAFYARVGGVSVRELAGLEMALCRLLDWRLLWTTGELQGAWEGLVLMDGGGGGGEVQWGQ